MLGSITATGQFHSAPARGVSLRGSPVSTEAVAIVGAAVGLLAVLVPLLLSIRANVAERRRDLHALAERVARIKGPLAGPGVPQTATQVRHRVGSRLRLRRNRSAPSTGGSAVGGGVAGVAQAVAYEVEA